jgi:hypothetical protein
LGLIFSRAKTCKMTAAFTQCLTNAAGKVLCQGTASVAPKKASQNDGVLTPEGCFMRIATVSICQALAPEAMPRQIRTSPEGGEGFNSA